jgi:alpha-glucosidase
MPTGRDLETNAISVDALHHGDVKELDAHSLFGTMQVKSTHDFFVERQKKRPMIISRSGYAGIGKWGSRWLGDNKSTIDYLKYSLTGVINQNIMGV